MKSVVLGMLVVAGLAITAGEARAQYSVRYINGVPRYVPNQFHPIYRQPYYGSFYRVTPFGGYAYAYQGFGPYYNYAYRYYTNPYVFGNFYYPPRVGAAMVTPYGGVWSGY